MNFQLCNTIIAFLTVNALILQVEMISLSECENLQPNGIKILEDRELKVWFGSEVSITCCMKESPKSQNNNNYYEDDFEGSLNRNSESLSWFSPGMTPITNYFTDPEKAQKTGVFMIPDMLQKSKDIQVVHLVIKNFTSYDSGVYKCDTTGNSHLSDQITIIGNPKIVIDAEEYQFLEEGKTGYINCRPRGHPKIDIVWFYEGEPLSLDNHKFSFLQNHQTLRISKVTEEFKGKYLCKAEVTFSDPYKSPPKGSFIEIKPIEVIVYQTPILTENSPMIKSSFKSANENDPVIIENEALEIECEYIGLPVPNITWYKDNKLLSNTTDPRIDISKSYYGRHGYSVLKIKPVQIQDIGTYTCNSSISLYGFSRSAAKNITPEFLFQPRFLKLGTDLNASSLPGKEVVLNCSVFGAFSNRLSVSFIQDDYNHNSTVYDKNTDNFLIQFQMKPDPINPYISQYQLTIKEIQPRNSGWYYCRASINSERIESISHFGVVSVLYAPTIIPLKNITYGLWYKKNILKCKAKGYPNPVWEWKFQDLPLSKQYNQYHTKVINYNDTSISELIISPNYLNDGIFGTYHCYTANQFGSDSNSVLFYQAWQPGAPHVKVCKVTSSIIQLCVTPNADTGGLPLTHYEMRIKDLEGRKNFGPYYYPVNPSTITLSHLMSNRRYKIALSSSSEAGRGANTDIEVTTKALSPPIIELVNTSVAPDWNAFNLRWIVDTDGGSPIVQYHVEIQQVEVDPTDNKVINRIGKVKSYVINDLNQFKHMFRVNSLHPNTWYELKFTAKNLIGSSVIQEVVFRTLEMPEAMALSQRLRDPFSSAKCLKQHIFNQMMALTFLLLLFK